MPFWNTFQQQESSEYGKRFRITTDMKQWDFELIYREQETGYHRTITVYNSQGLIHKTKTEKQNMVGQFNESSVKGQFDNFISGEWRNYINEY